MLSENTLINGTRVHARDGQLAIEFTHWSRQNDGRQEERRLVLSKNTLINGIRVHARDGPE